MIQMKKNTLKKNKRELASYHLRLNILQRINLAISNFQMKIPHKDKGMESNKK